MYRTVEWKEEAYVLGRYMDEAGEVQDLALAYTDAAQEIVITARESGIFGEQDAIRYTVEADGIPLCNLCKTESGSWYISTDGTAYYDFSKSETGEISEFTFSQGTI